MGLEFDVHSFIDNIYYNPEIACGIDQSIAVSTVLALHGITLLSFAHFSNAS